MPDYKTMYLRLFNRVTDAVKILQASQLEGEDLYVEGDAEAILISLSSSPD